MNVPVLAQCCICRTTTEILDYRLPLPRGWAYRSITADAGRYYCPRHARKA